MAVCSPVVIASFEERIPSALAVTSRYLYTEVVTPGEDDWAIVRVDKCTGEKETLGVSRGSGSLGLVADGSGAYWAEPGGIVHAFPNDTMGHRVADTQVRRDCDDIERRRCVLGRAGGKIWAGYGRFRSLEVRPSMSVQRFFGLAADDKSLYWQSEGGIWGRPLSEAESKILSDALAQVWHAEDRRKPSCLDRRKRRRGMVGFPFAQCRCKEESRQPCSCWRAGGPFHFTPAGVYYEKDEEIRSMSVQGGAERVITEDASVWAIAAEERCLVLGRAAQQSVACASATDLGAALGRVDEPGCGRCLPRHACASSDPQAPCRTSPRIFADPVMAPPLLGFLLEERHARAHEQHLPPFLVSQRAIWAAASSPFDVSSTPTRCA